MNRVQKFRSVEVMARAAIVVGSGDGFDRFARHCARYFAIAPRVYPRGVFRFRTLEEAEAARERVTADSIRLLEKRGRELLPG
jgi:hypothetical protein